MYKTETENSLFNIVQHAVKISVAISLQLTHVRTHTHKHKHSLIISKGWPIFFLTEQSAQTVNCGFVQCVLLVT